MFQLTALSNRQSRIKVLVHLASFLISLEKHLSLDKLKKKCNYEQVLVENELLHVRPTVELHSFGRSKQAVLVFLVFSIYWHN